MRGDPKFKGNHTTRKYQRARTNWEQRGNEGVSSCEGRPNDEGTPRREERPGEEEKETGI